MIKIICDICKKESTDKDFACDMTVIEDLVSMPVEKNSLPQTTRVKRMLQVCKGCFYTHISKHLKDEK